MPSTPSMERVISMPIGVVMDLETSERSRTLSSPMSREKPITLIIAAATPAAMPATIAFR